MSNAPLLDSAVSDQLYVEVQRFYAVHMHLLDEGEAERWAATFTEDGTFEAPALDEPVRGRAALAASIRHGAAEREAAGEVHRHWHGMITVAVRSDGALAVRCYALVFASPKGGPSRLHRVCVCEDVLVREGGGLRVRSRYVTRDDMPVTARRAG
ncbi:hydroxylacyl-CoA dehydrogenase [Streptomyces corchorusii]|uniref:Hydroxylacyl-CoA dehydrogenase n=2 Tax=Streptomyces TaxID=1883 RepID=A0A101PVL1_STRCK|nr:nuclear transport factor 2 family protein [Streptomyces corchorusii]KUN18490.1 hydroxylacyl-CoA dehydrogenase [Streptomyces corchorusii]